MPTAARRTSWKKAQHSKGIRPRFCGGFSMKNRSLTHGDLFLYDRFRLLLHLTANDTRGGFSHFDFNIPHPGALLAAEQQHRADGLAIRDDRRYHLSGISAVIILVGHRHGFAAQLPVEGLRLAACNHLLQIMADGLIPQLLFIDAAGGNHLISIHDAGDMTQGTKNGLGIILCKG